MEQKQEETLATPGVIEKYQEAGKISNTVLQKIIEKVAPGVNVIELTQLGDSLIVDLLSKVYVKKKKMEKGIAFPTCISINNIVAHYSPLASDANGAEKEAATIQEGDVVKIDLGVHIDGYISVVGHTVIAGKQAAEGKKADVVLGAYKAVQAALRQLKPGFTNDQITKTIQTATQAYGVNAVESVLSHDVQKHNIDGQHSILSKENFENKVDKHEIQVNEVWVLNVVASTGEGKVKESDLRTTVYKRAIERNFQLKTKAGRNFYHQIVEKYPTLCFSTRAFDDEINTKLGVSEAQKHELLNAYPVFQEKQGDLVASFNITVLVLKDNSIQIAGLPIEESQFKTENQIKEQEVLDLLALSMDKKDQKEQYKKRAQEAKN